MLHLSTWINWYQTFQQIHHVSSNRTLVGILLYYIHYYLEIEDGALVSLPLAGLSYVSISMHLFQCTLASMNSITLSLCAFAVFFHRKTIHYSLLLEEEALLLNSSTKVLASRSSSLCRSYWIYLVDLPFILSFLHQHDHDKAKDFSFRWFNHWRFILSWWMGCFSCQPFLSLGIYFSMFLCHCFISVFFLLWVLWFWCKVWIFFVIGVIVLCIRLMWC